MPDSTITKTKRTIVVRMQPGEDILETLEKIVKQYDIKGGQLQLIGAISKAHLGYFDIEDGVYKDFTVEKDLEVVSGIGNISRLADGTIVVHTHIVVADEQGKCYGGHLLQGCTVSVTIEVIINEFDVEIRRSKDEVTGLNLLSLK